MPHYEFPRPGLSADVVLLAGTGDETSVLLVKRGREPFLGMWALPGGFVDEGERIEDAARRELAEETCVRFRGPLMQVGAFGDPGRDPRGWTVSVAWLGEAGAEPLPCAGGDDAEHAEWHRLDAVPSLAFDHPLILEQALKLRESVDCGFQRG